MLRLGPNRIKRVLTNAKHVIKRKAREQKLKIKASIEEANRQANFRVSTKRRKDREAYLEILRSPTQRALQIMTNPERYRWWRNGNIKEPSVKDMGNYARNLEARIEYFGWRSKHE